MIKLQKIIDKNFHDPEYARTVANMKRILEKWILDASFQDAWHRNPEQALKETGLDPDPEAVKLLVDPDEGERIQRAAREGRLKLEDLPESYVLYKAFIREKLDSREEQRAKLCVPDEPCFRAWRARQERRCWLDLGPSATAMVQAALMFELSEGCSVGCPFCGVAAKGLRGIFRYTEEHALLWRDILRRLHALIGDAAGHGTCYYSCEGFDNPDYEKFLADYFAEFGVVPQTTTAASTRNIARTKALLQYGRENYLHIDRFSVLSPAMRDTIFESFSPEELLLVELLPQFPEAPACHMTIAGRNRSEDEEEVGSTIACASGFVVNMQEMSVRLMTPFVSDRAHPTGEWIPEKASFSTAEDLEATIRRMISRYMPECLDLNRLCAASCNFRLEEKEEKVWAHGHGMGIALMDAPVAQEALDRLMTMLREREYTGNDLLSALPEETDICSVILLLENLWEHGLIDQTEG